MAAELARARFLSSAINSEARKKDDCEIDLMVSQSTVLWTLRLLTMTKVS